MQPEGLRTSNLQRRFEALNAKAKERVEVIGKLDSQRHKELAKMIRILTDMHKLFVSKPVDLKFSDKDVEYSQFDNWVEVIIKPLVGFDKRQAFYALHVGKHLMGKVTDDELETMGIERAKLLSKVSEVKGTVSKALVERAISMPISALKEEVRGIINPNENDLHEEKGGWSTFEVKGPRRIVAGIHYFLGIIRRQEGHGPSDAEIIHDILEAHVNEMQASEEDRKRVISNVERVIEVNRDIAEKAE